MTIQASKYIKSKIRTPYS